MLGAVEQRSPALLPVVAWAYSRHRCLLVQSSDEVVRSQSGVRQRDSLGPLHGDTLILLVAQFWQSTALSISAA
jgi:hypothetical protein